MLQATKQKLTDALRTTKKLKSTLEHLKNSKKPVLILSEAMFGDIVKTMTNTIETLHTAAECCDVHSGVKDFRLMIPLAPSVREKMLQTFVLDNVIGCRGILLDYVTTRGMADCIHFGETICDHYGCYTTFIYGHMGVTNYCIGCPFRERIGIPYACLTWAARLSDIIRNYRKNILVVTGVWEFRGLTCEDVDKILRAMRRLIEEYTYDAPEHEDLRDEDKGIHDNYASEGWRLYYARRASEEG